MAAVEEDSVSDCLMYSFLTMMASDAFAGICCQKIVESISPKFDYFLNAELCLKPSLAVIVACINYEHSNESNFLHNNPQQKNLSKLFYEKILMICKLIQHDILVFVSDSANLYFDMVYRLIFACNDLVANSKGFINYFADCGGFNWIRQIVETCLQAMLFLENSTSWRSARRLALLAKTSLLICMLSNDPMMEVSDV